MSRQRLLLIPSIFILILLAGYACSKAEDPFPNVTLPVHPKAIDPKVYLNKPIHGAKSAAYRVKIPFPADDLTSFYDREMGKMGYVRFTEDGEGSFQWEDFNYKTGEWEKTTKIPARYTASWVDRGKSTRVWLYIGYKYDGMNDDWKVKPVVSVNVGNFFDLRRVEPPKF